MDACAGIVFGRGSPVSGDGEGEGDLSEAEGWLLLAVLKNVRLFQRPGYHADSAEDAVAYQSLLAEAKAREVEQPAAVPYIGPDRRACGNDLDDMVRAGLGGTE